MRWELLPEISVFCDFQKLKVQENPNEIPPGSMPRSIEVILRNEIVETVKPGDKCLFVGSLVVIPSIVSYSKPGEIAQLQKRNEVQNPGKGLIEGVKGLKVLGAKDLSYKMVFIANSVQLSHQKMDLNINKENLSEEEIIKEKFSDSEIQDFEKLRRKPNLYKVLANCISPSIKGHEDVKRGILLMLFGGVHKTTQEGVSLRGDINCCLVGDPSTAKSQFLKWVANFLPRCIYTSGKATSASGLTASVTRDIETGETCLEAGALLLADNGVCCIDEFDKMDVKDSVAIHEAMEQQTISIAKAGIQATLNARTSILAAANPKYGRYNDQYNLQQNLNISEPIMSRFDLFFTIKDECNEEFDQALAQHIVRTHRLKEKIIEQEVSPELFLRYLQFSKLIKPHITKEAAKQLQKEYVSLRKQENENPNVNFRMTVRQLESLIRLSEALARLHCSDEIIPEYVRESKRLLKMYIREVKYQEHDIDLGPTNIKNPVIVLLIKRSSNIVKIKKPNNKQ